MSHFTSAFAFGIVSHETFRRNMEKLKRYHDTWDERIRKFPNPAFQVDTSAVTCSFPTRPLFPAPVLWQRPCAPTSPTNTLA